MANVATTPGQIPAAVQSRLGALRRKIISWMLVDGLSRVVLLLIILGGADMFIVWAAKSVSAPMDFAQRLIMLVLIVGGLGTMFFWRVLRPFAHRPGDDALCIEVEHAFDELGESLISSVQFSRMDMKGKEGVSEAMVNATIDQGVRAAQTVQFGKTLNARAFSVNLILLLLGLGVIGGVAWGASNRDNEFLWHWAQRNVLLRDVPWPQKTYLKIGGVSKDGTIVMARGDKLERFVYVTEDSEIIPESVVIRYEDNVRAPLQLNRITKEDEEKLKDKMTPGYPEPKHKARFFGEFGFIHDEIEFRAEGGDAKTEWVKVVLLDAPAVTKLQLTVTPPSYTGDLPHQLPPGKGPYYVLNGSTLKVEGISTKPLVTAKLVTPEKIADGGNKSIPLKLRGKLGFVGTLNSEDLLEGRYEVKLTDQQGLDSKRTASFRLHARRDGQPKVSAKPRGITRKVVPQARIPLTVRITDDFSVEDVYLQFEWQSELSDENGGPTDARFESVEDQLQQRLVAFEEAWDLEPLNLNPGIALSFRVFATDNDEITKDKEPGRSSPEILLRVVTEEDLRTDMLRREKELREEFERLKKMQEDLQTDTQALRADTVDAPIFDAKQMQELMRIQRRQKLVGTNTFSVAQRLAAILVEVENNRLEEEDGPLKERLTTRIIEPMQQLAEDEVTLAVTFLDRVSRRMENAEERSEGLTETSDQQQAIIDEMQDILTFMVKAEGYQEAVNRLYEIEKTERKLREMAIKAHRERIKKIQEGAIEPDEGDEKPEKDGENPKNDPDADNP